MSTATDSSIIALRLHHCRAERAMNHAQYHVAALHYRHCLEAAERRCDYRAVQFFALRLADCYAHMHLPHKAQAFQRLARCCSSAARHADPATGFIAGYEDESGAATC